MPKCFTKFTPEPLRYGSGPFVVEGANGLSMTGFRFWAWIYDAVYKIQR